MNRFPPTLASLLASLQPRPDSAVVPQPGAPFAPFGLESTFAWHDPRSGLTRVHDEERARRRFLPAGTFEIPLALVALETGVLKDPHETFAWDGRPKLRDAWERDHTLATAMRDGAAWVFQDLARRVGKPRLGEWLDRLEIGNRDMTGGVDQFWLQGGLRVSALEQVEFLRKLAEGRLPVTARSRRIVREILVVERFGDTVIRAKAGTAGGRDPAGWWVGEVEKAGDPVATFALEFAPKPGTPWGARFAIGRGILERAGVLPAVTADACVAG